MEFIKDLLCYNPTTGIFTWKVQRGHLKSGAIAGGKNNCGYIQIKINGKLYKAHRLAWWLTYNEHPSNFIDHKNGIRDDNRICNLRLATREENNQNISKHRGNTSGHVGVDFVKRRKYKPWRARITLNHVVHELGTFATKEEAIDAYNVAKNKLHTHHRTE